MNLVINTSQFGFPILCCPRCDGENVHIEYAFVGGPGGAGVGVDSMRSDTIPVAARPVEQPAWMQVGDGSNVSVAVAGYCEHCSVPFVIVFEQEQGITKVRVVDCPDITHPEFDEEP
jgi:hypothetical protein